ncbi:MAG: peptide chain release factor N(5)-glutamine methyltransferase [Ekhidna sp.]
MKKIWNETADSLMKVYDRREAENISYLLLEDVFQISKSDVLLDNRKLIDADQLRKCIERLLNKEPLQYVTGFTYFFGRKFKVQKGSLIPRPETEELVQLIIENNNIERPKILDVGVGSGCICISLALELKGEVYGTDISDIALEIAMKNAADLGTEVSFRNHDILFSDLGVDELDILVSNPPYIPNQEKEMMNANVLNFEPENALFVPDNDPIIFYKRIGDLGLKSLKKDGKLYFEIHENFGEEVRKYLESVGYSNVCIHQDMQGKDRMMSAVRD